MSDYDPSPTTLALRGARKGDEVATRELFIAIYEELRRLAAAHFRRQPAGHTLQPTAIVHEAFLKLVDAPAIECEDREHFLALAARVLRQTLVDHARHRGALKRGGEARRVFLAEGLALAGDRPLEVLDLEEALTELEVLDERKARVVELRFFSGLTNAEAARILGVAAKTAESDWYGARAWLRRRLTTA